MGLHADNFGFQVKTTRCSGSTCVEQGESVRARNLFAVRPFRRVHKVVDGRTHLCLVFTAGQPHPERAYGEYGEPEYSNPLRRKSRLETRSVEDAVRYPLSSFAVPARVHGRAAETIGRETRSLRSRFRRVGSAQD